MIGKWMKSPWAEVVTQHDLYPTWTWEEETLYQLSSTLNVYLNNLHLLLHTLVFLHSSDSTYQFVVHEDVSKHKDEGK